MAGAYTLPIGTCCFEDKNLEILFRACNFRFTLFHTVLTSSVMSIFLSIMPRESFSETLFLTMTLLHVKLGNVLGVPRVIK